jgi:tRNA(fMet)-specific endonuclease VapC
LDDLAESLLVVDTDLAIDYLRGRSPGADRLQVWLERDVARFTAVTAFELRLGTDFERRGAAIRTLLSARTIPLDATAALLAGEVYARLRSRGQDIGVNDSLQAGICLRFGLPLATRNLRHFDRVEGLNLVPG